MEVFVDTRPGENNLFDCITELLKTIEVSVRLDRKQLLIGDVQISSGDNIILLERKTWADLISSLNDGRYTNQKARLMAERERNPRLKFLYLIEGAPPVYTGFTRLTPNAHAYAALTKMAIRDGVCCLWSASFFDSARMILYIVKTEAKGGFISEFAPPAQAAAAANEDEEGDAGAAAKAAAPARGYSQFVKHASKRKNTEDNMWEVILTSVPGISTFKALKIMDVYPTSKSLYKAYAELERRGGTSKELDEMLAKIMLTGDNAEADMDKRPTHVFSRLGPKVSTRLRNIFYPAD
jgi:ERCC4-type nuclease